MKKIWTKAFKIYMYIYIFFLQKNRGKKNHKDYILILFILFIFLTQLFHSCFGFRIVVTIYIRDVSTINIVVINIVVIIIVFIVVVIIIIFILDAPFFYNVRIFRISLSSVIFYVFCNFRCLNSFFIR